MCLFFSFSESNISELTLMVKREREKPGIVSVSDYMRKDCLTVRGVMVPATVIWLQDLVWGYVWMCLSSEITDDKLDYSSMSTDHRKVSKRVCLSSPTLNDE